MKIIRFWLPVAIWMGIIFSLSSRQRISVSDTYLVNFIFFKMLHILEYALLYLLIYRAFLNTRSRKLNVQTWVWAFVVTILYAVSDELHQQFVPTREGKLRDVIIDTSGATLSWFFLTQLLPKAPKKLKSLVKHWELI